MRKVIVITFLFQHIHFLRLIQYALQNDICRSQRRLPSISNRIKLPKPLQASELLLAYKTSTSRQTRLSASIQTVSMDYIFNTSDTVDLPSTLTTPGRHSSRAIRTTSSHPEMLSNAPDQLALCVCLPSARFLQFLRIVSAAVMDCVPGTHLL